jgi:uncharacterized protein (TIGR01777 family)
MRVAVTGSSGLIGTALVAACRAAGDEVVRVVRAAPGDAGSGAVAWDPPAGTVDAAGLEGLDAVVHLAGAGIGDARWTPERKRLIRESRLVSTDLLARTLASLERPPAVLVSASAVGWYGGRRGDEELDEDSPPPVEPDFLAEVCRDWEAATGPAEAAGIRVVHLRTGIVLARQGGVLARLLLPFRLGLGGRTGSGSQWMSWIALDDEVGAIRHIIATGELHGPVNATAPNPVTNLEFARTLARVLGRPAVLPTPLLPLRIRYGNELVQHLLVEGQRVRPARLLATGYEFAHPELGGALRALLDRPAAGAA